MNLSCFLLRETKTFFVRSVTYIFTFVISFLHLTQPQYMVSLEGRPLLCWNSLRLDFGSRLDPSRLFRRRVHLSPCLRGYLKRFKCGCWCELAAYVFVRLSVRRHADCRPCQEGRGVRGNTQSVSAPCSFSLWSGN